MLLFIEKAEILGGLGGAASPRENRAFHLSQSEMNIK